MMDSVIWVSNNVVRGEVAIWSGMVDAMVRDDG